VAARHIAESEDNPTCKIYLRGKNPRKVSPWQRKILEQLFVKEELTAAIEEALKPYGKDPSAYISEDERSEIKQHGFAPFIWLSVIVIDEIKQEVILSGGSESSVHIPEHGLSVYLRKNRWHWDEADYFIRYESGFEKKSTPAEFEKALKKEMKSMAAELQALVKGPEEQQKRWEQMFPATGPAVSTDASFLCGEWKFDVEKTFEVQKGLGEKVSLAKCQRDWGENVYRITPEAVALWQAEDQLTEECTQECVRRGNRFTIRYLEAEIMEGTSEYWCDGRVLVDHTGLAYRRVS
ncbi:MAG TPA: hypothetical protein VF447_17765, partial [Terriglobales bacterium]